MPKKNAFQGYWQAYGGGWSLLRSTYFLLAAIITILCYDLWRPLTGKVAPWVQLTVDVIPSLLGFALGGMAIMLAFSTGKFLEAIKQGGKDDLYFMKIMASFFHFTVVLTTAILFSYIAQPGWLPESLLWAVSLIGFFFSVYGILLTIATVASIWHTARIFNKVKGDDNAA